jgi:hypothetical protein
MAASRHSTRRVLMFPRFGAASAASTASSARYPRFTVAEDPGKGDPGFKPLGIRGMSAKMNKLCLTTAVVAGLAWLAPGAAHADIMWSLSDVTFNDGGTATGSFVITDLGNLTAWDITTTIGSTLGGATYDNTRGGSLLFSAPSTFFLKDISDTTELTLSFSNPLTTILSSPDPIGEGVILRRPAPP